MLNKERLINDLKEIHKEIVLVYKNIFEYKYLHESNFKVLLDAEYKKANKVKDSEKKDWNEQYIHRSAYTLINKILFIRICEDKGFMLNEEDKVMGEEVNPNIGQKLSMIGYQKWTNLITNYSLSELIKFAFKDMNRSYNNISLYKEDMYDWLIPNRNEIELKFVDDEMYEMKYVESFENVIKTIIEILDTSRYNFGESSDNVLGDVYEKFMDRDTRKALGQFYTPDFVIEYILKNTLEEVDVVQTPFVKVLDPSCGSGHFLIMAYDLLRKKFLENLSILREKYRNEHYTIQLKQESNEITGEEYWTKKYLHYHILKNCIYGADIDGFALQITTINLLLKDLENFITDEINIVECDSLVKWESDYDFKQLKEQLYNGGLFVEVSYKNILGEREMVELSYNESIELYSKCDFWNNSFDYIIGNPPYVRQENIKNKGYLENRYVSYQSRADLLVYFIERALNSLSNDGKLGFIISDKFTRANYGRKLRKFITNRFQLEKYKDDFNEVKTVFQDVVVDAAIMTIKNTSKSSYSFVYNDETMLESNTLTEQGWYFSNQELLKVKKKMDKLGIKVKKLDDIKISYGIKSGLNDAFVINTELKEELCRLDPNSSGIIKPYIRGRDLDKYSVSWKDLWIIVAKFGSYKELPKQYPAVYEHLKKFEEQLKERGQCRYSRNAKSNPEFPGQHHWLELDNNPTDDYLNIFESEKIIYPDMSTSNKFFLDRKGYYTNDTTFLLTSNKYDLKYISGLLNSNTLLFYFRTITSKLGKEGRRYKKVFIDEIPIVVDSIYGSKISSLVDELLTSETNFSSNNPTIDEYYNWLIIEENRLMNKEKLHFKINQLAYLIYNLTPEEIILIENEVSDSITYEKDFYFNLIQQGEQIDLPLFETFGSKFVEEASKVIPLSDFIEQHVLGELTIEEIARIYGFENYTIFQLRKYYASQLPENRQNEVYNLSGLKSYIKMNMVGIIKTIFGLKTQYQSSDEVKESLSKEVSQFDKYIDILRDDISKNTKQVLSSLLNEESDTFKSYMKKRKNNKFKQYLKYDNNVYGLSSWSDEIHKKYFIDAINYYTTLDDREDYNEKVFVNVKKTKKKAEDALSALKDLDFKDKEDYLEILTEKVRKAFD